MKNKLIKSLIILIFLISSSIPFIASYEILSNNIIYFDDDIKAIKLEEIQQSFLFNNTLISNNIGNDYHPRMTTNSLGHTIVVYEQEIGLNRKQIPVMYSTNGHSWIKQFLFDSINFTSGSGLLQYPDILYNTPNDLLYLTMIDPNAEMYNNEMSFIPGNIANAEEASWYGVSSATGYYYSACACSNNFFLSLSTEDTYGLEQTLCLGYFTYPDFKSPPVMGGWYYDGNSFFQSSPAAELEMDSNANQIFFVFETEFDIGTRISIKTNIIDERLMTSGRQKNGMEKYADPEVMPSEYLGFGTDPDVSGSGNKVCVVYIEDENVICKSSSTSALYDPEFNWHTSLVERSASAPAVYMQGNNVYCTYVKKGNLYLKISEDTGVTWNEAIRKNDVNGTVVGKNGSVDICESGIAFTDSRNGNYDIYFASYEPIPTPILVISDLSPMKMTVKNIGTNVAYNISWILTIDGKFIILGKQSSGLILGKLEPSQEITVGKTRLILGFGHTKITGDAWADNAPKVSANIRGMMLLFFFYLE
jgi:hypothetical protein